MRLFNLAHYQPMPTMARGRSAFHLKPLVAKNMQADPAHQPGATGERWSGHVSYKRVTKALQDAERACIRAWERKRTPVYCTLELQYAWRISLARAHLWTLDGEPDHDDHSLAASDGSDEVRRSRMMVPRVVRSQLFRIYCERMANEQQQVKQLLFSNHTSSPLLPRTTPRPFRVTVHARRGDRVYHPDGPQSEDGLGWVRATGGDVSSIAALVEALVSEVEACGAATGGLALSVHSEAHNSHDLHGDPTTRTPRRRRLRVDRPQKRKKGLVWTHGSQHPPPMRGNSFSVDHRHARRPGDKVNAGGRNVSAAELFGAVTSKKATEPGSDSSSGLPWGPTTRRLLQMATAKMAAGGSGEGREQAVSEAVVYTTNSLASDLAYMVAADAFVMSASSLSNLAAYIRGGLADAHNAGSSQPTQRVATFTDRRNDHLPVTQFDGDSILRFLDPLYCTVWDGKRFVLNTTAPGSPNSKAEPSFCEAFFGTGTKSDSLRYSLAPEKSAATQRDSFSLPVCASGYPSASN